jgi:hypothetical protein
MISECFEPALLLVFNEEVLVWRFNARNKKAYYLISSKINNIVIFHQNLHK